MSYNGSGMQELEDAGVRRIREAGILRDGTKLQERFAYPWHTRTLPQTFGSLQTLIRTTWQRLAYNLENLHESEP